MPAKENETKSSEGGNSNLLGATVEFVESSVVTDGNFTALGLAGNIDANDFASLQAELDKLNSGTLDSSVNIPIPSEDVEIVTMGVEDPLEIKEMDESYTERSDDGLPFAVDVPGTAVSSSKAVAPATSIVVVRQQPSQVTSTATKLSGATLVGRTESGAFVPVRHQIVAVPSSSFVTSSQGTLTTASSNFVTLSGGVPTKLLQTGVKRSYPGKPGQVVTKFIIANNPSTGQAQPQPVFLSTSQGDQPGSIRIISTQAGASTLLASPGKTLTLAPAQTVGLISPTKNQLPASPSKPMIISKMVSPTKGQQRLTVVPSTVKTPTKILPAPATGTQLKSTAMTLVSGTPVNTVTQLSTSSKPILASPQKVILRPALQPGQTLIKTSAVGGTGSPKQIVRLVTTPQVQSIHGRQLQYVRLVTSVQTSTTTTVANTTATVKTMPSTSTVIPISSLANISKSVASAAGQTTVKVIPIAPATQTRTVAPKPAATGATQHIIIPANAAAGTSALKASSVQALSAGTVNQLPPGATILSTGSSGGIVVVPAQYLTQLSNQTSQPNIVLTPTKSAPVTTVAAASGEAATAKQLSTVAQVQPAVSSRTVVEPNGLRPRKPCNCTKSQCLKLYCDCFANGEFCNQCNCINCFNNLTHEEDRQRAIKSCLERNPQAFRPKIGKGQGVDKERRHNKGCNCKRSGCLKNYCECYEAKIPCSGMCKCIGCKNFEEAGDQKTLRDLAEAAEVRVLQQTAAKSKLSVHIPDVDYKPTLPFPSSSKPPYAFLTMDVVKATCQCLLAQAEDILASGKDSFSTQSEILNEFSRSLVQIIQCASGKEERN